MLRDWAGGEGEVLDEKLSLREEEREGENMQLWLPAVGCYRDHPHSCENGCAGTFADTLQPG